MTADTPPGLYDRPVLVVDPNMHTAMIGRADVDAAGHWGVTGSLDKTVRIWSLSNGALCRTIRLPAGSGHVGKVYAVAISPDGALIAAGGITRPPEGEQNLYVLDRASGALIRTIEGLPDAVGHLVFSRDGEFLAAALTYVGLRIYSRSQNWAEIARDIDYRGESYGAAFASDGRLATTSNDGKVRVYSGTFEGDISPAVSRLAPGPAHLRGFMFRPPQPYGIAFSPDGTRLAVGYSDRPVVVLLDASTLSLLSSRGDAGKGDLHVVAWSRDGGTLFSGGRYATEDCYPVLARNYVNGSTERVLPAGHDLVTSLAPLPENDLLVTAGDPWLARLQGDGHARWIHPPTKADFRDQFKTLFVSSDGTLIDFGFAQYGTNLARFDLVKLELTHDLPADDRTAAARQGGVAIENWRNSISPMLDGRQLKLEPSEFCRCMAVHPAGDRFVLGADWFLRAFDAKGTQLWRFSVPGGAVWTVNVTGDGRLVVAAYDDGTIRWHRMDDGREILAFMPLADRVNWVVWTPEGFYAASPGAHGVLRWHMNRGWEPARSVAVADIPGFYRPEVIPFVLKELETPRAIGLAVIKEQRRKMALLTDSGVAPGARLHLLAVGVSAYNPERAAHLRLEFAQADAHDVVSVLSGTQDGLYVSGSRQYLADDDATRASIRRGLATLCDAMMSQDDLAVVHFSGHGALVDGELYLLPQDVDPGDAEVLKDSAFSFTDFKRYLIKMAERGRVLVLLDACYSGGAVRDGQAQPVDARLLSTALAGANISVLTSSSADQKSRENQVWRNGAFTEALLEGLREADTNRDGLISMTELAAYLNRRVRALTNDAQQPAMEIRFDGTLFAVVSATTAGAEQ